MKLGLLVLASVSWSLAACGGLTTPEGDGPPPASTSAGPPDALSCSGQPTSVSLASDCRPALASVVTDGTHAYWVRSGAGPNTASQIVRAPLAGGAITLLASGTEAEAIAVDATDVYFTTRGLNDGMASVYRLSKEGGTPAAMVPQNARVGSPEDPSAAFEAQLSESRELVIDDEAVYWIARVEVGNVRGRHVLRAPKRGGDAALLTDELAAPAGLAVAPTAVYWVDEGESQAPATLRQTDKRHGAKGSGTVVASGETFRRGPHDEHDGRFSLAADEASVYFLSAHDGTVIRVASGGAAVVLASDQHAFNAISVGGGHVYWTWSEQYGRTGGVARVPVAGGPATTLSNDPTPRGVVYDPSGLVVTTSSDLTRLTTCQ